MKLLPDNGLDLMLVVPAFLFVLSLWAVGVWLWSLRHSFREQKVERRLGLMPEEDARTRNLRLWREGREVTTSVPRATRRRCSKTGRP